MSSSRITRTRSVLVGVAASAAVAGIGLAGAGVATADPTTVDPGVSESVPGTYDKTFVSRFYPSPQSAVIGAQVELYLFNSVRLNGNQACSEQPKPVVKPDTPVGWTATVTATCLTDAGTGRSSAPVGR